MVFKETFPVHLSVCHIVTLFDPEGNKFLGNIVGPDLMIPFCTRLFWQSLQLAVKLKDKKVLGRLNEAIW